MDKPALWSRGLIVLMGVNFCSALSFYLIMVEITAFAVDTYALPASVAGLTISVYVISALLTRMFFGGAIDSWGVKRALVLGCAVNVAATVLYLAPLGFAALMAVRAVHGFAHDAVFLLASAALAGFGIGATQSIVQAVIARDTPPGELGKANSTFFMSMDLGSGVGPVVIGALIPVVGYSASYLLLAVAGLLAGVDYHVVHGRKAAAGR